jgi:glycine cleavage system H protein
MYPSDRRYTRDFAWIRIEGDLAVIGLTDHAARLLNDSTVLSLPAVDRVLARGEAYGLVETVKVADELASPVSGVVVAVNSQLAGDPGRLAADPHGAWIVKVRMTRPSEVATLLSNAQFEELLASGSVSSQPAPASAPVTSGKAGRAGSNKPSCPSPAPPAAPAPAAPARLAIEPEKALRLLWTVRLGGSRLQAQGSALGDRDTSGGSYFSWREREIAFTDQAKPGGGRDRRFRWRDTTHTRVSAGGLSNSTTSHADYAGTWDVEATGRPAYLVLEDRERGRQRLRLDDGAGNLVLINGRPHARRRS